MNFNIFGCGIRRTQSLSQVAGNQIAGNGYHCGMTDGTIGINRDIGRTSTDVNNTDTQIFFIIG